ncbi:hypothetical protein MMC17_007004 [Xylographa soralifera]|nr:hypothetical protein [Xylographa soralifera]
MKEESALVDALLQKLESAKATYVTNLNEAHDAVVASLKTTQNDEDVVQESSQDSLGRTNAKTKREDILQTERDPLDCETFYADHDLKEFLGDLDAQLLYERLEPDSTGGGFIYVCNGRIMDGPPLKENILKLLQPLPSLEFDADDGKLHNTRANDPGWVYNDHQASFNAIWFTFLDGDYSGSWNLYHDAVSEEHPQNFWEMIRAACGSSRTNSSSLCKGYRDFLFSKDTRERFFADDAQLTLARRYFWALQTLSTINESLKSIMETWERHQSAFDTNDRLPYFHRKLTSVEKLEVKRSTQEIVGTIKSMAERIVKNEERRSEIMTLRDGSILGVADLPKFFQKLAMNRLAIAMPVVCVSAYLTVAALEPHGESFIGRGARRLRELTIGLKEDHDGHDTPVVVVGEAATGEGYP